MPQVAMDARGDAVAVWPGKGGLYAATLPASSHTWQAAMPIVTTEAEHPHVALDAGGDAVAVWESVIGGWEATPGTNTIEAAVKPVEGAWGLPASLSEPVAYSHLYPTLDPSVAVSPQGSAIAAWDGYTPTDQSLQAAVLPAVDGSWQPRVQVADTGGLFVAPLVGIDEHGNGVALWEGRGNSNHLIEADDYDASSPVLEGVNIPATGTAGQSLTFAVSPLAASTALGQTTWAFGDGSQPATGAGVSHAFVAPGTYHVTVAAADVLGNATSASSTVVVTAPPSGYVFACGCRSGRPPKLSNVRITHKRFRVTGRRTGRRAQPPPAPPLGTKLPLHSLGQCDGPDRGSASRVGASASSPLCENQLGRQAKRSEAL